MLEGVGHYADQCWRGLDELTLYSTGSRIEPLINKVYSTSINIIRVLALYAIFNLTSGVAVFGFTVGFFIPEHIQRMVGEIKGAAAEFFSTKHGFWHLAYMTGTVIRATQAWSATFAIISFFASASEGAYIRTLGTQPLPTSSPTTSTQNPLVSPPAAPSLPSSTHTGAAAPRPQSSSTVAIPPPQTSTGRRGKSKKSSAVAAGN